MCANETVDEEAFVDDAADAVATLLDRKLTPEEFETLKGGLSDEVVLEALLYGERSYFVIGSYGTDERDGAEKERLVTVRNTLEERHPDHHAFLLDDLPEFYPNWVVQFFVAVRRVDHIVGVFEHSFGGHEYEAGVLTPLSHLHEMWILKRVYESESRERSHFDGMMADFFGLVAERETYLEWSTERELKRLAAEEIPGENAG